MGCHPWEKKHSVRGKSLGSSVLCRVSQTEFRRTPLNLMVIRCIADIRHKLMKSQWALKTVKDEQVWMVPIFFFLNTFVEFLVKVHSIYGYSINRIKMTRRGIKTFFSCKSWVAIPAKKSLERPCRDSLPSRNVRTCQDLCQLMLLWRMTQTYFLHRCYKVWGGHCCFVSYCFQLYTTTMEANENEYSAFLRIEKV